MRKWWSHPFADHGGNRIWPLVLKLLFRGLFMRSPWVSPFHVDNVTHLKKLLHWPVTGIFFLLPHTLPGSRNKALLLSKGHFLLSMSWGSPSWWCLLLGYNTGECQVFWSAHWKVFYFGIRKKKELLNFKVQNLDLEEKNVKVGNNEDFVW